MVQSVPTLWRHTIWSTPSGTAERGRSSPGGASEALPDGVGAGAGLVVGTGVVAGAPAAARLAMAYTFFHWGFHP